MKPFTSIRQDILHFLVSAGIIGSGFLFYVKYGFYGWPHVIAMLCALYAAVPLDDWMEGKRPFPWYVVPLLLIAAYLYPLVTLAIVIGDGIANLQAILKKRHFWLERLEGLGNVFIAVLPFTLPNPAVPPSVYPAVILFLLFADSFHKIGHQETNHPRALWLTGIVSGLALAVVFATPSIAFLVLVSLVLISLLPFSIIRKKKQSWLYTQIWLNLIGFAAYSYYLFVFLD